MTHTIKINNVSRRFGKKEVLNDITLSLEGVKIYGLIGVNGSGKSTLLKIMTGLLPANSGDVLFDGESISNPDMTAKIGFMIESPVFYPYLSGKDNLLLISGLYPSFDKGDIDRALNLVRLSSRANDLYKAYSLGMKQRLYFALAIMSKPDFLLLDEPFNGVDPMTVTLFESLLREFAKQGCVVLVSSHQIRELQALIDAACIIDSTKVVREYASVEGVDLFADFLEVAKNSEGIIE